MVTDLNYRCVYVHFLCVCACVAVWEPSPSRLCDDVTGAFQGASEGGKDSVEGLLFSHTWLGGGQSVLAEAFFVFDVQVTG